MTPRAKLASDRFSPDQLLLRVSQSYDRDTFDLDAYEPFIDEIARGRDYQADAVRTVLRLFCGGRYADTAELARESYDNTADLQRRYATEKALIEAIAFPDLLSCSLDLATGTGKSFAMYAVARIMLNEGIVDRVLLLCPSPTIEAGLREKFNELTASSDLTNTLPIRPTGHPIPTIVDAGASVKPGEICIENVHATYAATGSSLRDSFVGNGDRTLVISDEAHHILGGSAAERRKWHDFISDDAYGFAYHLGVSGTCYVGNDYFSDVVYRYSLRGAIADGWVKQVYYLAEDQSSTDDERFQKLLAQHEKNRGAYPSIKPLTIAVTKNISAAKALASDLTDFLASQGKLGTELVAKRVLIVTSADEHKGNVQRLATVDSADDAVEWIVSVSMLTEGWDVKNVFQIYPHEKRAFNSKLLVSQVLGRGLRVPDGVANPIVYVFNHQAWGKEVDEYVAEILDQETTIAQRPVVRAAAEHFTLHQPVFQSVPTGEKGKKLEANKKLTSLTFHPQINADEDTKFISATDQTRSAILTTKVTHRLYDVDDLVAEIRAKLRDADKRAGGTLAKQYTKTVVENLIVSGLKAVGAKGDVINQENRQIALNGFGGLRQRTAVPKAKLVAKPTGLKEITTSEMRAVNAHISGLTSSLGLFYDEQSKKLSEPEDVAALDKALAIDVPTHLHEVPNSFDFKSPTNVVLTSHTPELRFVQKLVQAKNAGVLRSWVKSPDTGFYEIEYTWQEGGQGRSKRSRFNPDFFLLLKDQDTVVVVETKADNDATAQNAGKGRAADAHFALVNTMLKDQGSDRRYVFRFLSPVDYDRFFESLRDGKLDSFKSTLQGALAKLK